MEETSQAESSRAWYARVQGQAQDAGQPIGIEDQGPAHSKVEQVNASDAQDQTAVKLKLDVAKGKGKGHVTLHIHAQTTEGTTKDHPDKLARFQRDRLTSRDDASRAIHREASKITFHQT